jgi:hypothetical protein
LGQDLDILILPPAVDELTLQEALVDLEPDNFFLRYPRSRNATFMKLYYRIPGTSHKIKVDLLLSTEPKLEIPHSFRHTHFVYLNQLAVAPLYFVLYHKLLGWEDRVNSREYWKRLKAVEVDYPDIIRLCIVADRDGLRPLSKSHMGRLYLDNFYDRADSFAEQYEPGRTQFRRLGFSL